MQHSGGLYSFGKTLYYAAAPFYFVAVHANCICAGKLYQLSKPG